VDLPSAFDAIQPTSIRNTGDGKKVPLIGHLVANKCHRANASVRIIERTKNPRAPVPLHKKRVVHQAAHKRYILPLAQHQRMMLARAQHEKLERQCLMFGIRNRVQDMNGFISFLQPSERRSGLSIRRSATMFWPGRSQRVEEHFAAIVILIKKAGPTANGARSWMGEAGIAGSAG
jgi:hypothetical protein